ncbi:MAG: YihY/virulence factor BrkB family protein [Limisphaerales bacterium]
MQSRAGFENRFLRRCKEGGALFKEAFRAWMDSKASRLGASLAYYTIFAIAPLFLIAISMAAFFFGQAAATRDLYHQINSLVGHDGGDVIQSLVAAAAHRPRAGLWATFGALITLGTGATAVFVELQDALNTIWCVESKGGGGVWCFIKNRLLSFAMVLGIGFLLLVSLLLNAALTALGSFASGILPEKRLVLDALNFVLSLGVITLLFALIYKLLPDVNIAWGDVWVGAFVTALLFNLGKFLIGYYLGRGSLVSIYGAAGSFIVLLLWVYYSAQILFFGAEFTRVHSQRRSRPKLSSPP